MALRHAVPVSVVSNSFLRVPPHKLINRIRVSAGFDAADDYIAERANMDSIVITSDILLAERCVKQGAYVLAPNGKPWDQENIGSAVAMRNLMADLRAGAVSDNIGGPAPFGPADRSRFLQVLHQYIELYKRR